MLQRTALSRNIAFIILIIIVISQFIGIGLLIKKSRQTPVDNDSLNRLIENLQLKNNRSTSVIDSVRNQLNNLNENYEKDFNTILNQPVDSDIVSFSNYIERFTNSNYSRAAENN